VREVRHGNRALKNLGDRVREGRISWGFIKRGEGFGLKDIVWDFFLM
jgi:hypothetical protein